MIRMENIWIWIINLIENIEGNDNDDYFERFWCLAEAMNEAGELIEVAKKRKGYSA